VPVAAAVPGEAQAGLPVGHAGGQAGGDAGDGLACFEGLLDAVGPGAVHEQLEGLGFGDLGDPRDHRGDLVFGPAGFLAGLLDVVDQALPGVVVVAGRDSVEPDLGDHVGHVAGGAGYVPGEPLDVLLQGHPVAAFLADGFALLVDAAGEGLDVGVGLVGGEPDQPQVLEQLGPVLAGLAGRLAGVQDGVGEVLRVAGHP
jgi:hypothetical protein